MTGYYALGPLGLLVSALGVRSLYNARRHGRVRTHGWVKQEAEPRSFRCVVSATAFAAFWFGLIGIFVSPRLIGLL